MSTAAQPGTVINEMMHHGSITKTVCQLPDLPPLARRDASATGNFNAVNLVTPRQPTLWPTIVAPYVPPNPEGARRGTARDASRPLTPPALGLLGPVLAKYEQTAPRPQSCGDAIDIVRKHGRNLFGNRDT